MLSQNKDNWQPLCSYEALVKRTQLYNNIRRFFNKRNLLEVETPLLSKSTVTDPYINSIKINNINRLGQDLYLQTSPEYYIKRLLCSDIIKNNKDKLSGVYEITKAFRAEEQGSHHNIEFNMLEWYRLNYNLEDLMAEMGDLLKILLKEVITDSSGSDTSKENKDDYIQSFTYFDLFNKYLKINYITASIDNLKNLIKKLFNKQFDSIINHPDFNALYNKDDLLMILMSDYIEPRLDKNKIIFVYDYPKTQAALAKVDGDVANRFEVYCNGLELANGYYELTDSGLQEARFSQDLNKRAEQGSELVNIDNKLLNALEHGGLPECSGVALGLDRVLMLQLGVSSIDQVLLFRA